MSSRVTGYPSFFFIILLKSKRKCALCFIADGRSDPQIGQIVHLDHNAANRAEDNLAFLCLSHHAQYDSHTSRHKSYTVGEVKAARERLYAAVAREEFPAVTGKSDARAFEEKVTDYVREQFTERLGDLFSLHRNLLYSGRSGVSYEVDLATQFVIGNLRFVTIFEIKSRLTPASASELLEFAARSKDVGADKAVFVCAGGFSAGAAHVARAEGIGLIRANISTGTLEPTDADEGLVDGKTSTTDGTLNKKKRKKKKKKRSLRVVR